MRRIALSVGLLALLCAVTLVFLAGRPPRTFAASWTSPGTVSGDAGDVNFGAVAEPLGRWDLLWVDGHNHLLYRAGTGASTRPVVLDNGDVEQPTLVRVGKRLFGAWIHNYNGATQLVGMLVSPGAAPHTFVLIRGKAPIEHPYAFAGPGGRPSLVLSWQRYGNFDTFLLMLQQDASKPAIVRRLTTSQYYSFYPEAITDARGHVDVIHLESCCDQNEFNVLWDRYDASGRRIAPTTRLGQVQERGLNTLQHGEAVARDGAGDIWVAYTLDSGVGLLHATPSGVPEGQPMLLDPAPEQPQSLDLALGEHGGYGVWEQDNGIGTDIASRHFDAAGMSGVERIEYLSGHQQDVHAGFSDGLYRVIWQSLTPDGTYVFETNQHRKAAGPDLAQRLGLGLGNPWGAAGLLFIGALGLGVMGAAVNLIDALVLVALGLLLIRALRILSWRWLVVTILLTGALYALFVRPGLPILFLTTLPNLGFGAAQFVLAATAGSLLFVGVTGQMALRRLDDIYRLAIMVFLGLFFFAFIEGALFVQQEFGYI